MSIKIEKGIPMIGKWYSGKLQRDLSKMEIGDSFVTHKQLSHFHGAAKAVGIKLKSKHIEHDILRIWRIE